MSADLGIAWNEGFADYFAVASKTAISTAGLNIPGMATTPSAPTFYVGPANQLGSGYRANGQGGGARTTRSP